MKKTFFCAALLFTAAARCDAGEKRELGIILGEPTGISYKQELGGNKAFDAAAAWSFSGNDDRLHLHADHLWFKYDALKDKRFPLYYGLGVRLKLENRSRLGARFPVGLQYFFPDSRLTAFLEIAPILDLAPDTELQLNAAIGLRLKL
ncbi:MAG: hypothetical protein M0025_00290 [Elusimicrobia bacterium]|nr:hypothetical protein [Elusimicrobiota bacterium]